MRPLKTCKVCGRSFCWRRKWTRNWDAVRYCSAACRRRGLKALDRQIEAVIMSLLAGHAHGVSLCELERLLETGAAGSAGLRGPVRMAVRRLCHAGAIELLQSGHKLGPDEVRGDVRLHAVRCV